MNYRSNRNGQDFAFPEDFQLPYYGSSSQSRLSASFYDYDYGNTYWNRSYLYTVSFSRNIPRVFSQTLVLNPKDNQAYTQKYNADGTLVKTKLRDFRSLRLIVGTGENYHNTKTGVTTSMPPKFRITGCSLKIYK